MVLRTPKQEGPFRWTALSDESGGQRPADWVSVSNLAKRKVCGQLVQSTRSCRKCTKRTGHVISETVPCLEKQAMKHARYKVHGKVQRASRALHKHRQKKWLKTDSIYIPQISWCQDEPDDASAERRKCEMFVRCGKQCVLLRKVQARVLHVYFRNLKSTPKIQKENGTSLQDKSRMKILYQNIQSWKEAKTSKWRTWARRQKQAFQRRSRISQDDNGAHEFSQWHLCTLRKFVLILDKWNRMILKVAKTRLQSLESVFVSSLGGCAWWGLLFVFLLWVIWIAVLFLSLDSVKLFLLRVNEAWAWKIRWKNASVQKKKSGIRTRSWPKVGGGLPSGYDKDISLP